MKPEVVKLLLELRHNQNLWRAPKGAGGGQDKYVGLPPAMRILDEIFRHLNVDPNWFPPDK